MSTMTVTCNDCSYTGSIDRVKLHSCQIQEQGGRCEDYPCCGHTDGDGCQTLLEHTSEYWLNRMYELGDRYDELDASGGGVTSDERARRAGRAGLQVDVLRAG